jgi:hypothetical protein
MHIRKRAMKKLPFVIVALLLILLAAPALAAEPALAGPGFWSGLVDGFLSLFKLLISPLLDVSLVADEFGTWSYSSGYYVGVLMFLGTSGAVASDNWASTDVLLEVGKAASR